MFGFVGNMRKIIITDMGQESLRVNRVMSTKKNEFSNRENFREFLLLEQIASALKREIWLV